MNALDQYEIIDGSFRNLILGNAKLRQISSGHLWTEGPVWFGLHNCLLFSDIPNERIFRWQTDGTVSVFREKSDYSNGHTSDLQGQLISCLHGRRCLIRTEHNGSIQTLADSYDGKKLNSPNDVVVKSDGTIWFTDPTYGIMTDYEGYQAEPEQSANQVFKLDPATGDLTVVVTEFTQPNGLAFSPDEKVLYIAESGHSHDPDIKPVLKAFDVNGNSTLENGRDFAIINPGLPDGLRVDAKGHVWVSAADGVHCLSSEGKLLGKILVPQTVSNLTFGGPRGNMLFITATSSVYAIHVNAASANGR